MSKILLTELADDFYWLPYNSKVTPIALAKNKARDDRIYLLLVINDDTSLAFNHEMKKVGILTGDETNEFYDQNERYKIKTEAPIYNLGDPDASSGVGHFYDMGAEK